jgi:amino acid transporter
MATNSTQDDLAGGGLNKETNWWGAFVIGLAGTILVTGIAPLMLTTLGASSIPPIIFITLTGVLLCLLLAEMSAMMPDRTGGSPSYAYPAFQKRYPRLAPHINGITAWAYWLGWFPVAPLNMILASFYLSDRLGWSTGYFTPIDTPIAYSTLIIAVIGIIGVFVPAYLGIRLGTAFATVLGLLSMVPLTFLAIAWIFKPSIVHWGNLSGFHQLDGSSFFSGFNGHGWLVIYIAYAFLLTWNVIAMEAAACYIGECRDPERDAKIAMNLEGLYGLFIYTLIPVGFVLVIGNKALGNVALADPKTMFVTFASKIFGTGANWLDWLVALMLIVALMLSALNAIMGCARSLHQMSIDGQFPRVFSRVNRHGVPSFSMGFNVVCSLVVVVILGGAAQIYTFSNVGYLGSFLPVLLGYYFLRQDHPDWRRPFKLPEFMKYVALAMFVLYLLIWSFGGLMYSSLPTSFDGGKTITDSKIYFFLGWATLLTYVPLWWYRVKVEDPKHARAAVAGLTPVEQSFESTR